MTTNLQIHLDRIRRRKWLVAVFAGLGLLIGLYSAATATTTYSSKAALTVLSTNRAPEQDGILSQGYSEIFNDPAYQPELRKRAGVADDITFSAFPTLASPLISITASSDTADDLQDSAAKMAAALRDAVNDALQLGRASTVATVQKPLDQIRAANGIVPEQALVNLQDRISTLNSDTTNQLLTIPMESTVSSVSASRLTTVGLPLIAGTVVGCLVALALGAASRRFHSAFDVTHRTDLAVLAEFPANSAKDDALRERSLSHLANMLAVPNLPRPATVTIVSPRDSVAVQIVARGLAKIRAGQGVRTLLVDADMRERGSAPGFAEYLSESSTGYLSDIASLPNTPDLREIGRGAKLNSAVQIGSERIAAAIDDLRQDSALSIIATAPLLDSAEAQATCAAADRTIMLIERSKTTTADVAEALRLLEQVGSRILGVVLVDVRGGAPAVSRPGEAVPLPAVAHSHSA